MTDDRIRELEAQLQRARWRESLMIGYISASIAGFLVWWLT